MANRGLNSTKSKSSPSLRAQQIITNSIRSSEAEHIFGNFFNCTVYRYTKRMTPIVKVATTPFGHYISHLQFSGGFYFDENSKSNKLELLNSMLDSFDYEAHTCLTAADLSDIEKFTFKV